MIPISFQFLSGLQHSRNHSGVNIASGAFTLSHDTFRFSSIPLHFTSSRGHMWYGSYQLVTYTNIISFASSLIRLLCHSRSMSVSYWDHTLLGNMPCMIVVLPCWSYIPANTRRHTDVRFQMTVGKTIGFESFFDVIIWRQVDVRI
jgi:hypothetical protein